VTAVADLQEQLQAILGDPEAMGQITAVARALTGGGGMGAPPPPPTPPPSPSPPAQEEVREADFVPVAGDEAPVGNGAPDLSQLLSIMGGGLPGIDPRLISIALRVYGEYSAGDDQKTALLNALKPFLREERREKIDKAVQIARLSRVVRVALQLLKEEGGHV